MACIVQFIAAGDSVEADSALTFGHTRTAQPTSNPIETGATITDHVLIQPQTVAVELHFSPRSGRAVQPPDGLMRPVLAARRLLDACQNREQVTVTIDGQVYSPAIIVSCTDEMRAAVDSRSVRLQVQQLLVASAQLGQTTHPASGTKGRTQRIDKGRQQLITAGLALGAGVALTMGDYRTAVLLVDAWR